MVANHACNKRARRAARAASGAPRRSCGRPAGFHLAVCAGPVPHRQVCCLPLLRQMRNERAAGVGSALPSGSGGSGLPCGCRAPSMAAHSASMAARAEYTAARLPRRAGVVGQRTEEGEGGGWSDRMTEAGSGRMRPGAAHACVNLGNSRSNSRAHASSWPCPAASERRACLVVESSTISGFLCASERHGRWSLPLPYQR
eukprot:365151-Chlamydomonas_euryale.AAC.17